MSEICSTEKFPIAGSSVTASTAAKPTPNRPTVVCASSRLADARNVDFAWMQDNIEGVTLERWFHEAGCRRWFTAKRDTTSDRFLPLDD